MARQFPQYCQPPQFDNRCDESYPFGGCNDPECQEQVCNIRQECCNTNERIGEWSSACVQIAADTCGGRSCFLRWYEQGCGDPVCEEFICQLDDFCCKRSWDSTCVQLATEHSNICRYGWPKQSNSCFQAEPFGRPGCINDPVCQSIVCNQQQECCSESYTEDCRKIALTECELPEPTNHCFEVNDYTPGCNDALCENVVCAITGSCCYNAYTQECVDTARRHAWACVPPKYGNDCLEESPYGGCNDERCAITACEVRSGCCDSTEIGTWGDVCTKIAAGLCVPDVIPKPNKTCPLGFACGENDMVNCTELRLVARDDFKIGDIYAGIYCEHEADQIRNCPVGYYCPTPEEKYICPAGKFCPHKTQSLQQAIPCGRCQKGATKQVRDSFGFVVLVILAAVAFIYISYQTVKRYNTDFVKRLEEFEKRVFTGRLQEFEHRMVDLTHTKSRIHLSYGGNTKHQEHEFKKIRHKVELINRRLQTLEENSFHNSANTANNNKSATGGLLHSLGLSFNAIKVDNHAVTENEKVIEFDPRHLFDALDTKSKGELKFKELNLLLALDELELSEFGRRMNELAGQPKESETVTRPVFVKYFLPILKETSNLTVSFEEAGELFDEMADSGKVTRNEIHMSKFYNSSMTNFLSDLQICDLITVRSISSHFSVFMYFPP